MAGIRQAILLALAVTPLGAATAPVAAQETAPLTFNPAWLSYDSITKTVNFKLIAGLTGGAKSPFNFNGFTDGDITVVVPQGATVIMPFVNDDGTPHSAMVIDGTQPIPNMAGDPAIPRAYTRQATQGLAQGQTDTIRFKAEPAGLYRIFCGVPGHGLSGMWIWLEVRPSATTPAIEEKSAG